MRGPGVHCGTHTSAIGADDCREGQERAQGLEAMVRLEILHFQPHQHGCES